VIKICIAPGAKVSDNETVIVLESMKMEHQITAHRAGLVRAITVSEGQTVERDAPLVELG
jgi:biotin carboxyl carrier protein